MKKVYGYTNWCWRAVTFSLFSVDLFSDRSAIEWSVSIAKAFRIAAERESGYKQLKGHLVFMGIDPDSATTMARNLNNACWVYDHFQRIT